MNKTKLFIMASLLISAGTLVGIRLQDPNKKIATAPTHTQQQRRPSSIAIIRPSAKGEAAAPIMPFKRYYPITRSWQKKIENNLLSSHPPGTQVEVKYEKPMAIHELGNNLHQVVITTRFPDQRSGQFRAVVNTQGHILQTGERSFHHQGTRPDHHSDKGLTPTGHL
jgi:hypothetical protein